MPFSDPKRVEPQIQLISFALAALSALAGLFHVFRAPGQVELFSQLDMPPGTLVASGLIELLIAVAIIIPRTRPWGAAALTFFWMGAVMWHVMSGVKLGFLMLYFFPISAGVWLFVKTRPPSLRVTP